ncbi:hypothetical protein EOM09_06990 [bacterium]|nr:hypothetical protein [bacterium]
MSALKVNTKKQLLDRIESYIKNIAKDFGSMMGASIQFKEVILEPIIKNKMKQINQKIYGPKEQAEAITKFFSMVVFLDENKISSDGFHKKAIDEFMNFLKELKKEKYLKPFVDKLMEYGKIAEKNKNNYDSLIDYLMNNVKIVEKIIEALQGKS